MSEEKQLRRISTPTALDRQAARPESGDSFCYRDIEILVTRGLDGEPEIRLNLKREFAGAEHNSRNRLRNRALQNLVDLSTFNPILVMLAIAFTERAFKDFHNFDEICDFAPLLNYDSRILEWTNPMGALLSVSIDVLNALRQQSPSFISSSTSGEQRNVQHRSNPGAWRPGHASYYIDQNTTDQPTSSTEDNQLILAGAASQPSEAVIRSDGTPKHSQAAGSISSSLVKTIPGPLLATPSLVAPTSPCLTASALSDEGSQALDSSRPIHELITKGRYECLVCKKDVRPVSHIWSCQICRVVLHLSCTEEWVAANLSVEGWPYPSCNLAQLRPPKYICWCGKQEKPLARPGLPPHSCGRACSRASVDLASLGKSCCDRPCEFMCHTGRCPPCGYEEPLQGISSQSSEDKARHLRPKQMREEMGEPTTHDDDSDSATDDNDQPPLKKYNRGTILHINSLIEKTKSELEKADEEHCRLRKVGLETSEASWALNRLKRRYSGLVDVQQYILDRENNPMSNGLCDTPLLAIDDRISDIGEEIEKVKGEFDTVHKGGKSDNQPERLHRLSLLEQRYKDLIAARKYILGRLSSSDSSPVWV